MSFFLSSIYLYTKTNSKLQMVMKDVCGHEFLSARLLLHTECSVLLIHLTCLLKKPFLSHTHKQLQMDTHTTPLYSPSSSWLVHLGCCKVGGRRKSTNFTSHFPQTDSTFAVTKKALALLTIVNLNRGRQRQFQAT